MRIAQAVFVAATMASLGALACSTSTAGFGDDSGAVGTNGGGGDGGGLGSSIGVGTGIGGVGRSGTGTGTGTGFGASPWDAASLGDGGGGIPDAGAASDSGACSGSTCCPHALPAGFAGVLHRPGGPTNCTTATLDEFVDDCFGTTDADMGACTSVNTGTCAVCAATNVASSTWGPFLFFKAAGTAHVGEEYPFGNLGGCILAEDPSASGQACGKALQTVTECELAACVPHCPVGVDSNGAPLTADQEALLGAFDPMTAVLTQKGCLEEADDTVCAGLVAASQAACAVELDDSGALPGDECEALAAAGTLTQVEALVAVYCGGG